MITSKDNNLIKLANQIKTKKFSREHGLCLVESIKIVSQLYLSGVVSNILVTEDKFPLVSKYTNAKIDIISDSIADYLSDTVTTDGVIAICKIPNQREHNFSRCLVLDRIQDPSNLGAIIRSAMAFGFKTILSIDSVYPYTYKCIRASMGYVFDIDILDVDYSNVLELKKKHHITFITADMDGVLVDQVGNIYNNIALVIGNEGQGVSLDMRNLSDTTVRIPMQNDVESLNASVSASILMYELNKIAR